MGSKGDAEEVSNSTAEIIREWAGDEEADEYQAKKVADRKKERDAKREEHLAKRRLHQSRMKLGIADGDDYESSSLSGHSSDLRYGGGGDDNEIVVRARAHKLRKTL